MKTITLEELRKVKAGDKVQIVDKEPANPRCGWADASSIDPYMDAFLGKVCTVKRVDTDIEGRPILRLVEDNGEYSWTEDMIELVIYQKQFNSLSDAINNVLKNIIDSHKFVKTIKKVIYNKPATIIIWADGTKTTAKCAEGETYDPEKGLILCALKKFVKTEEIMDLLQFAKEDNGTVTYKDVINKKKAIKKNDKTREITIDCTNKSTAQVKAEIRKITKKGDK